MLGNIEGRVPEGHYGVTNIFIQRALFIQHSRCAKREDLVDQRHQNIRCELLGHRREVFDVHKHHRNVSLFTAEL